jgi:hypothetical protein
MSFVILRTSKRPKQGCARRQEMVRRSPLDSSLQPTRRQRAVELNR